MTDSSDRSRLPRMAERDTPVVSLASQALRVLAAHRTERAASLSVALCDRLHAATMSSEPDDMGRVLKTLRSGNVADDTIVDAYIPRVARALGADWCEDEIGFAATTIGSARLQALLRDVAPDRAPPDPAASAVAVVVLGDEHHTLGAMVLAAQLRRLGLAVRVILGLNAEDSARRLELCGHDAIFVSTANERTLGKIRNFVENVKRRNGTLPVAIGGPIVNLVEDVCEQTGADFATTDPLEAVERCGLTISTSATGTEAQPRGRPEMVPK